MKCYFAKKNRDGFTLLEVMIAILVLMIIASVLLPANWKAKQNTERARNFTIATMLARDAMVEAEQKIKGKTFKDVDEEEGPTAFPAPYADYSWKREIKEIKFPQLSFGGGEGGSEEQNKAARGREMELAGKLISQYLSDSLREVTVTVQWKTEKGTDKFTLATYWVNLNAEFRVTQ